MKRVVYKYPINQYGLTTLQTSSDPKVLSAQFQRRTNELGNYENLVVWIEQDEEGVGEREEVKIFVAGTGHLIDASFCTHHITTVQSVEGFVWHVYQANYFPEED